LRFLLDTNVISEMQKLRPNEGAVQWLQLVDETTIFISVLTWAEIRHGTETMPEGAWRRRMTQWLEFDLAQRFYNRILPIDFRVADQWGKLMAERAAQGQKLPAMDALIAATALVHDLAVVTHNVVHFHGACPHVVDPWD